MCSSASRFVSSMTRNHIWWWFCCRKVTKVLLKFENQPITFLFVNCNRKTLSKYFPENTRLCRVDSNRIYKYMYAL